MAELSNEDTYVFTKEAVLRSIAELEQRHIHEHFAGYLAVLRATKANQGLPALSSDITDFHDRYLKVVGAPDRTPYVRPFKSRGHGLEVFNANVAGSYAPSSLRSGGKLIDVIDVQGQRREAKYSLHPDHARMARDRLLTKEIPVGALVAFLYRDYGFHIEHPDIERVVALFRKEFGMSETSENENKAFEMLFEDDLENFSPTDFEVLGAEVVGNG